MIAVGAHKGNKMGIPGEDVKGVMDAIDFLRSIHLGESVSVGQRVCIVGGGNSAIDAARVAIRKGAKEVNILYRREKYDMPADEDEIISAQQEGVHIHPLVLPSRIISENGNITGVECQRMEPGEFGRSGRRTPRPVSGSEYVIKADMLIEAIGQEPDTAHLILDGAQRANDGKIVADSRTLLAEKKGIFAAGDAFQRASHRRRSDSFRAEGGLFHQEVPARGRAFTAGRAQQL